MGFVAPNPGGSNAMKPIPRLALAVPALICLGAQPTTDTVRSIPGFSLGENIDTHDVVVPSSNGREIMDPANDPTRLHPQLRPDLLRIENARRAGSTARRIFPSNWWPMRSEGIAARWNSNVKDYANWNTDRKNLAPTEKYDLLFYPGQSRRFSEFRAYSLAESRRPANERGSGIVRPAVTVIGPTTAWEMANHGTYQDTYPEAWWGHCNGWSSYVTAEKEGAPLRDIIVRRENDKIIECNEADPGCVYFRMADIEALMSEVYFHDTATIAGRRCNVARDKIDRDELGRPTDPACRDLNPGTLHVAVTGLLGQGAPPLSNLNGPAEQIPFIMDFAYHDEVWTFPVIGYEIRRAQYITETQASRLVCQNRRCRSYRWNENATRFASVEMVLFTMTYETSMSGLLDAPLSRTATPSQQAYSYVLELDGRGTILGGEWITAPRADGPNSKELHPDFIFMSMQSEATTEDDDDRGGRVDNPYVSSVNVRELLRISRSKRPNGP
jgi:Transglutaminase elicitor